MFLDLKAISQPFSNEINIGGKTYLYFGGTAYLGIPQNKDFIEIYVNGIAKFGLNNGTSRKNNIQLGIYNDAESAAAERFKAEDALITSSGYLAAQLTVNALSSSGKVIYAPNTHPALWLDNPQEDSQSFLEWAGKTTALINTSRDKSWVLISNSMNNLFPELYNFDFLNQINPDKKIVLIVDDSHGIGVNNNGMGIFSTLPKCPNIEIVVVASMAKALGLDAGIVLSSKKIIQQLKDTNIYIGASPPSAAGLYAFIRAEEIYKNAWGKLRQNYDLFKTEANLNWRFDPQFPVVRYDEPDLSSRLMQKQILISSFPYPNINDKPLERVVLSSWHTEADILRLIAALF